VEKWEERFDKRAEASVTLQVAWKWDRGKKFAEGGAL
jgi:hypothetical protein